MMTKSHLTISGVPVGFRVAIIKDGQTIFNEVQDDDCDLATYISPGKYLLRARKWMPDRGDVGVLYQFEQTLVIDEGRPFVFERLNRAKPMDRYIRKPTIVEAVQWDGSDDSSEKICDWTEELFHLKSNIGQVLETTKGQVVASPGDWIIKVAESDFDLCNPQLFEAAYERITDE